MFNLPKYTSYDNIKQKGRDIVAYFKILNRQKTFDYKEQQRQLNDYYANLSNQLDSFEKKEIIHYIINLVLKFYPIKIFKLNTLDHMNDTGSVIFTANHSNSLDVPMLCRILKKHFFVMADYTMQNDILVNIFNRLNGCIYVDRKSKKSGVNAFNQAVKGVSNGYNMLIFSEATWNLFDQLPMLPRHWGDLKIAQATGRPIMPIALVYNEKNCFVKFGQLRTVTLDDDIKKIDQEVFDEMTQLRQDIWNSDIYKQHYQQISYEDWLRKTIKSYRHFDVEYEMSMIRQDESIDIKALEHILAVGEEINPIQKIEKRLIKSKINYRLK